MMTLSEAQQDLSRAYVGGGPGVVISGLIWLVAAWIELTKGIPTAFTVLFFGGMLIFPISALIRSAIFRRAKESADNRLGMTVLESTIAMIGGLLAAWLFISVRPDYVFPLAAIAVGTHYFAFRTAYGDTIFWVLAALITLVGLAGIFRFIPIPGGTILAVAIIEIVFGVFLTIRATQKSTAP